MRYLIIITVMCSIGCSSTKHRDNLHKTLIAVSEYQSVCWDDSKSKRTLSNSCLDKDYINLIGKCSHVLNAMEKRADGRRRTVITLSIIGAIAGGVLGPAVIASEGSMAFSAGLSGFAGMTNTAQQTLTGEGYTRNELINSREYLVRTLNGIVQSWGEIQGLKTTNKGSAKLNAKLALLNKMTSSCSYYQLNNAEESEKLKKVIEEAQKLTTSES